LADSAPVGATVINVGVVMAAILPRPVPGRPGRPSRQAGYPPAS
jgi:hypothetical protein